MKLIRSLMPISIAVMVAGCQQDWLDYSPMDMYSAPLDYDDSGAPMRLKVAAVTIQPDKEDKAVTLERMSTMITEIRSDHPDIQVIVFGELIMEWYWDEALKDAYQRTMSEPVPGPTTYFIQNLAITQQVNIVFGLTEMDTLTNEIYNTQVLVRPTGELVSYRKRNLNDTDVDNDITSGDSLVTTIIDGVKVAMFICSDMQSEQITQEIADADVDVILHSVTSTTDMNADVSYVGTQMNTWVVFANRYGTEDYFEYTGFSHIINPVGTICERAVGNNVYVYRDLGIY